MSVVETNRCSICPISGCDPFHFYPATGRVPCEGNGSGPLFIQKNVIEKMLVIDTGMMPI